MRALQGRARWLVAQDRQHQRFRGGLVFKAHIILYHSTLGLGVIKKKRPHQPSCCPADAMPSQCEARRQTRILGKAQFLPLRVIAGAKNGATHPGESCAARQDPFARDTNAVPPTSRGFAAASTTSSSWCTPCAQY